MNRALVKLVEHHGSEVGQQRVLLQPGGEDPLGRKQNARARGKAALEPDVPSSFFADGPALLSRDALGDGPCRDSPGLEHDHRPVYRQNRRHASRFSRARRRREHERALGSDEMQDFLELRVDWQLQVEHARDSTRRGNRADYSCLKATVGSTASARRSGIQ